MLPELDSSCETKLTLHQAWPMPVPLEQEMHRPVQGFHSGWTSALVSRTDPGGTAGQNLPGEASYGCAGLWMGHSDPTPVLPGPEWACCRPGQGATLDCRSGKLRVSPGWHSAASLAQAGEGFVVTRGQGEASPGGGFRPLGEEMLPGG